MPVNIIPTKVYEGKTSKLVEKLSRKNKHILLVTGKNVEKSVESVEEIKYLLGKRVSVFSNTTQNPLIEEVEELKNFVLKEKIDFVIGIGGGSVLDLAKAACVIATNKGDLHNEFLNGKKAENAPLPFVAVPTTAGTGSEITPYSAIYENVGGKKRKRSFGVFREKNFFPIAAILDPSNLKSAPKKVIASSGFDALCQCIESLWSNHSTTFSEKKALEGINLFVNNFEKFYKNPSDADTGLQMLRAANLGGVAISQTMTTSCHSISYALTMLYRIPHGHAVALSMPQIMKYNFDITTLNCLHPHGPRHVKKKILQICNAFGVKTVDECSNEFLALMKKTGLQTKLREFGAAKNDISLILENAFSPERMNNNPRKISVKECRKIIEKIM